MCNLKRRHILGIIMEDNKLVEVDKKDSPTGDCKSKKGLSWKDVYQSNSEFREKHKKRLAEKIACECGKTIVRGNMSKHKHTDHHKKAMEALSKEKPKENDVLSELIRRIVAEELNKLKTT